MNKWIRSGIIGLFMAFAAWVSLVTQGAYFGMRLVRWFYDLGSLVYDQLKGYQPLEEEALLGRPIALRLPPGPAARVLDVGVGTGRLPEALLARPEFAGWIVGVDMSPGMLAKASRKLADHRGRVALINAVALPLTFADATFDAVTSLEALEFMPDPRAAIREMVRVLRPGGWLVITNRTGPTALFMPGRVESTEMVMAFLASLGLVDISRGGRIEYLYMDFYAVLFARKPADTGRYAPVFTAQNHPQNR
jgi:ubiquinone/menaquinone biosynthesis C-methylase UbiE